MADDDLKAELERLKAENQALKSQRNRSTSLKVSEKGALSIYGMGRFPVTLYKEQWLKLIGITEEIKSFIKPSPVQDLKEAVGQFILYGDIMPESPDDADRTL